MEITVYSESGREYTITENKSMDICIIMDCMTSEAQDGEFDDKHIYYNFVNYVFGQLKDLSEDVILDYINEYEEKLTITGFEHDTNKRFTVYKGK